MHSNTLHFVQFKLFSIHGCCAFVRSSSSWPGGRNLRQQVSRTAAAPREHNGGFCNGCTLKNGFLLIQPFPSLPILLRKRQNRCIFITFIFHHTVEQLWNNDIFLQLCKHSFLWQPLQNPTLCSSTIKTCLHDTSLVDVRVHQCFCRMWF